MGTAQKSVYFEDLSIGQEASVSNTVTADVIAAFADVSGDRNPVHVDADYAAETMFKETPPGPSNHPGRTVAWRPG